MGGAGIGGGGGCWESGGGDIFGGSCHKYNFCRDKTCLLPQQKYGCRDKTSFYRDKHVSVATKLLSRQNYVCRDKHFVATSILLSRQTCLLCLSR